MLVVSDITSDMADVGTAGSVEVIVIIFIAL